MTENRCAALCAAVRPSGGNLGAVSGLSAVESVISGNCLDVKDSLLSGLSAILDAKCTFRSEAIEATRNNRSAESSNF